MIYSNIVLNLAQFHQPKASKIFVGLSDHHESYHGLSYNVQFQPFDAKPCFQLYFLFVSELDPYVEILLIQMLQYITFISQFQITMKPKSNSKAPSKIVKSEILASQKVVGNINNPWTEQPIKNTSSFGQLNSIIKKYYGDEPKFQGNSYKKRKQIVSNVESIISEVKRNSQISSCQKKQLLYDKYRDHFDLIGKLVIINNIIAFINSAKDLNSFQGKQYSTNYFKVPCESQATFLKLYYRITKPENLQFVTLFNEKESQTIKQFKSKIVSKLYL